MTILSGVLNSDLLDVEGNLERPVAGGGWWSPSVVTLDKSEKWLEWGDLPNERPPLMVIRHPGTDMLEQFLRLSEASGSQVLRYARRWGVLMRCEHGLSFALVRAPRCDICLEHFSNLVTQGKPLLRESVGLWRRYAREFEGLLAISVALHDDRRGKKEDWTAIRTILPWTGEVEPHLLSVPGQRSRLQQIVQQWCVEADVQILFEWHFEGTPSLTLGGNLLAALVIQLMLVITRGEGLALCDSCGKPFCPKKRPNPNRRKFCSSCGLIAAWRYAKRDQRQRIKESQS